MVIHTSLELLRAEIATAAARVIAQDGIDYGTAKRKAAKRILGNTRIRGINVIPDNAQIEEEVRTYNALFFANTQPIRLLHLRQLALEIMEQLAQFNPYLTGAVLNGTAGENSPIHLQLFTDNQKDITIYLLNKNIQFDVLEDPHFKGHSYYNHVEIIRFTYKGEDIHLALHDINDLRGNIKLTSGKRTERVNITTFRLLMGQEKNQ